MVRRPSGGFLFFHRFFHFHLPLLPRRGGSAQRAYVPIELDLRAALGAGLLQLRLAEGAHSPFGFGGPGATGAGRPLFDFLQQRLLFKRARIGLSQRFRRAQNQIHDEAGDVEHRHDQRGEQLGKDVPRSGAHIAERPNGEREPQGRGERAEDGDAGADEVEDGGEVKGHEKVNEQQPVNRMAVAISIPRQGLRTPGLYSETQLTSLALRSIMLGDG